VKKLILTFFINLLECFSIIYYFFDKNKGKFLKFTSPGFLRVLWRKSRFFWSIIP